MLQIVLEFVILQFHMKKKNKSLICIQIHENVEFSCAVVDINLLQINCSQNFLLKMCKQIV
jgi:hypothetical protein